MSDVRESAILAALAVILISIPAASQNVEIKDKGDYHGVIDSKFADRFEVDFEPGKMLMEAVDSEAKFEINESFKKKVVRLQTAEGAIKKVKTNDTKIKTVTTPYGDFKSGFKQGENISEFDGADKKKAEELKKNLENRLDERLSEAKDKKQVVVSRILPDIDLDIQSSGDRHFNLTNNEDKTVSMENWQIVSKDSSRYSAGLEGEIRPGETKVYYSGDKEEVDDGAENAIYDSGLFIYKNSGEVTVYNAEEKIVDQIKY